MASRGSDTGRRQNSEKPIDNQGQNRQSKAEAKEAGSRRQNGEMPMNNQEQNKQTKAAAREAGLNSSQSRELHDRVHGQGMNYQEILEEAFDIKDRRKGDKPWKKKHGK